MWRRCLAKLLNPKYSNEESVKQKNSNEELLIRRLRKRKKISLIFSILYYKTILENWPTEKAPDEQAEVLIRISEYLESYAKQNQTKYSRHFFENESHREPKLYFGIFVERLANYANLCLRECVGKDSTGVRCAIMAVEYLERIKTSINSATIQRYFLVAFLMAFKFSEDAQVSNGFWSKLGGVSIAEVNKMEIAFCRALKWSFSISPESYKTLCERFCGYWCGFLWWL